MIIVDDTPTVSLDSLLRFVAVDIPEVPYEVALDMLRQAYVEFARKSNLLGTYIRLPIQRGVRDYPLEMPEGYELYTVRVGDDGRYCWREPSPHYWYLCCGYRYRMIGSDAIELADAPSRDGVPFTLTARVLPNECVTDIPTAIATPYGRGLAMGAVADMLEMPGRAWTNPRMANLKRMQFNRVAAAGRALDITDHGAKRTTFPPIRIL